MSRKELDRIPKVSGEQVEFGKKLGLDLSGCTINVAAARIRDEMDGEFWGRAEFGHPTEKQVALAAKYGYDITGETRALGDAVVDDVLTQLNLEAIASQDLRPGDHVVNTWDAFEMPAIVSSIQPDGLVFFKGGDGQRAWARNLRKVAPD